MYRDVLIQAVLNGWKVKVGCQEVVFTNITEMLVVLKRYYEEPEVVEREYVTTKHAKHVWFPLAPVPSKNQVNSERNYEGRGRADYQAEPPRDNREHVSRQPFSPSLDLLQATEAWAMTNEKTGGNAKEETTHV